MKTFLTKKEIMTKFGISSWHTLSREQFREIADSRDIDMNTKYWIINKTPYLNIPRNEENSVFYDLIIEHISNTRIQDAQWDIGALIAKLFNLEEEEIVKMAEIN